MSSLGAVIRAALVAALSFACAPAAFAQLPHPLPGPPTELDFLPRLDWKMSAASLADPDPRFAWDIHWAGDFDLFSYPGGRASFLADYEALTGNQLRPFDPYQSNYQLEASASVFAGRTEVAGVLSHISRHLGDRPKGFAVAENSLGPRVMRRFRPEQTTQLDLRADVRKVIAKSYDDYTWVEELELVVRHRLTEHAAMYARGYGELIQVDNTVVKRDQQKGGRVELGVWLKGKHQTGASMELFFGAEQVIDADPLDRDPRRWPYVGLRLLGH